MSYQCEYRQRSIGSDRIGLDWIVQHTLHIPIPHQIFFFLLALPDVVFRAGKRGAWACLACLLAKEISIPIPISISDFRFQFRHFSAS